jgi:hypothetical protein
MLDIRTLCGAAIQLSAALDHPATFARTGPLQGRVEGLTGVECARSGGGERARTNRATFNCRSTSSLRTRYGRAHNPSKDIHGENKSLASDSLLSFANIVLCDKVRLECGAPLFNRLLVSTP